MTQHVLMPAPTFARWTAYRKLEVLTAIHTGEATLDELKARHGLSTDEVASWDERHRRHGLAGLRACKLQAFRA